MKWFKYRYPYRGRGFKVAYVMMFAAFPFCFAMIRDQFAVLYLSLCELFIAAAAYFIMNRQTDEEQEKTEYATPLEWEYCDAELLDIFRERKKIGLSTIIIIIVFDLLIIITVASIFENELFQAVFFITADLFIIFWIYVTFQKSKWGRIDSSAEYACPEVDHVESVKYRTKHGVHFNYYAVFYLPDGRYMISMQEKDMSKKLYLIRFNGNYTYLFV